MMVFDPVALRTAFGGFLSGVTIVATRDREGTLFGFTANSFSSVSLDPPMLLVCPGRRLSSFEKFETCEYFAVSILAEGQENVSNIFASYQGERFSQVQWKPDRYGVPLIANVTAHFSCKKHQVVPAGDHIVLLGEITDFEYFGKTGLGYASGNYFSLDLERKAASKPAEGKKALVGAIIEADGKVLLEKTPAGICPPQFDLTGRGRVRETLCEMLTNAGYVVELERAYSLFEDRQTGTGYTFFLAKALLEPEHWPNHRPDHCSRRFYALDELAGMTFVSDAHAAMLNRFALEYVTQDFALYIGDEREGDTHNFNKDFKRGMK